MLLRFYREEMFERWSAFCSSDFQNSFGTSPLADLLMDDGGLPEMTSISWIENGIVMVDSVIHGDQNSTIWSREDWFAEISPNSVTIQSVHEENCFETLSTPIFREILHAWRHFLLASSTNTALTQEFPY